MTEMGNEWCTGTRLGDGWTLVEVHVLLSHAEPPVFFLLATSLHFTYIP